MDMTPQTWPEWYDGRHINEVRFCQQFLEKHPMKCVRGRLFTVDGLIEDEGQIGNLILEEISGVLTANLSKTVANLLASIKLQAYSPPLPIETDRIHVANGTYFMDGSFTADKSYCNNRLTVAYNPVAPTPKKWLQFLSELLQPEDIPTLQEFLGYCLLPTTKGQKMLMLIGKGGEGKSRIGLVVQGGERTVSEAEEPDIELALVTLDALALHVHFALGCDDGFDIVGLGQGAQIHIIVHHQELVLQVRTAEPVALHLLDAGGIHAVPQQRAHDKSDAAFALAALTDEHEHLLSLGGWQQTVA